MNLERGSFRLWLVLSLLWVLLIAAPLLVYWPDVKPSIELANRVLTSLGVILPETTAYTLTGNLLMLASVTLLPPLGLFVLSSVLVWVMDGFRRTA